MNCSKAAKENYNYNSTEITKNYSFPNNVASRHYNCDYNFSNIPACWHLSIRLSNGTTTSTKETLDTFLRLFFPFFFLFCFLFEKKGEKPETSFSPFPGLPLLFKYFFPQIYGWLILMIVLTSGLSDVVTNEVMFYIER